MRGPAPAGILAVVLFIRTASCTALFCHIPLDVWNKGLNNQTLDLSACSEVVLSTWHWLFDIHSADMNKSSAEQTALEEILALRWRFPSVRYTLSLRPKRYGWPSVNLAFNEATVSYLSLYLRFFQIDGVDLPLSYVEAIAEDQWRHLRDSLNGRGVQLSTTISNEIKSGDIQRIRQISIRVDRIFLAPGGSSFFFRWRPPVASAFDSLELNVGPLLKMYTSLNLSLDKLIVGQAIESILWADDTLHELADNRSALIGRKATLDLLPYWRTCDLIGSDGWLERDHPRNAFVQAAVAPSGGKWLFQMNPDVVAAKADLLARYGFGGIIFYDLHVDDYLGKCTSSAGETYPLAKSMSRAIAALATSQLHDLSDLADDCIPFFGVSSGCRDGASDTDDPGSSSSTRVNCSESTFEFNDTCIPLRCKSDGQTDCGDGADEADCPEENAEAFTSTTRVEFVAPQVQPVISEDEWNSTEYMAENSLDSAESGSSADYQMIEGQTGDLTSESAEATSELPLNETAEYNSTEASGNWESVEDAGEEPSDTQLEANQSESNSSADSVTELSAEYGNIPTEAEDELAEYLFDDYESLKTRPRAGGEPVDSFIYSAEDSAESTSHPTEVEMSSTSTFSTTDVELEYSGQGPVEELAEKATEVVSVEHPAEVSTTEGSDYHTPSVDSGELSDYFNADSVFDAELLTEAPPVEEEPSTASTIATESFTDSEIAGWNPPEASEPSTWWPMTSETSASSTAKDDETTPHWLADRLYDDVDHVTDVDWLLASEAAESSSWETSSQPVATAFASATETQSLTASTESPIAVSTAHYEPADPESTEQPCRTGPCGMVEPLPAADTPQPIVSVTGARNSLIVQINAVLNLPNADSVVALVDLLGAWNSTAESADRRCHLAANSPLLSVLFCGTKIGQQPADSNESETSSSLD